MGDLSPHFSRSEFACKCGCGFDTVDVELLIYLEKVRTHFEQVVTITSACRCPSYNHVVGGTVRSQHLLGRAADIAVANVSPALVQELLEDHPGGLGSYNSFTHIDTRNTKTQWRG